MSTVNASSKSIIEKCRPRSENMVQINIGYFPYMVWQIKCYLIFVFFVLKYLICIIFSLVTLQVLYKLKTSKVFEKSRNKDDRPNTDIVDEDPYAIQIISWCPESRMLCIAGVSAHVIIYRFSKQEVITEVIPVIIS